MWEYYTTIEMEIWLYRRIKNLQQNAKMKSITENWVRSLLMILQ